MIYFLSDIDMYATSLILSQALGDRYIRLQTINEVSLFANSPDQFEILK